MLPPLKKRTVRVKIRVRVGVRVRLSWTRAAEQSFGTCSGQHRDSAILYAETVEKLGLGV